ncbi:MAG: redoxin domain-containing protein [Gammaproteobacteria bacterium]|nr:redoxin domain-containing protein [Gammaproteobacteria bacterium]
MTDTTHKPKPSWARRLRSWAMDAALLILIIAGVHFWQTRDMLLGPAPPISPEMPALFAEHLRPPAKGEASLVVFWADWCPICRLELGTLQSLSRAYRLQSIAAHSGTAEQVAAFMAQEEVSFPVWIDESGDMAKAWGVSGYPAAFVIDDQGHIRYRLMGYSTGLGVRIRLWLASF